MAAKRKGLVAILLVCGLGALGAMLFLRDHGTTESLASAASKDTALGKGTAKNKGDKAKASTTEPAKLDAGTKDKESEPSASAAAEDPPLDRPLRVVSLGWDLAVPGHLANHAPDGKESALAKRKLDVEMKSVKTLGAIKAALANGGGHKAGADIAILPLPEMVASYEDLRALKPQIFFVAGWSRGRDALFAHKNNSLLKLPRSGKIELVGRRGTSSMLLSLYLLDIAGVDSARIKIADKAGKKSMYSAIDRGQETKIPADSSLAITSADASALIPFVAIAPQGFLQNRRAIAGWIAAWLEGAAELEADVPKAARQVSALSGAPETLTLVRNLGLIEFSGLRDNVRRAGLAGRDPVTLASLFQLTWRLWRGIDALTTPAPKNVPIDFTAISALALQSPELAKPEEVEANFTTEAMVRGVSEDLKGAAQIAGVFARSSLRVGAFGKKKKSSEAIDDLATRYGLNKARLETKAVLSRRKTIVLEVFAAP